MRQKTKGIAIEDPGARTGLDGLLQLQQISTSLIQEDNAESLYARVLDAAINLLAADSGSLQLFVPETSELSLLVSRGFHPESSAYWQTVSLDSGCSCALAMTSGSRAIVRDVESCELIAGTRDLDAYRRSGIRAVQSTPLISRAGELLGMISTHWRRPYQPSEFALKLLDALARQAADLIERARTDAALRESEERSRWLAAIVESSDDAIVSKDLNGTITSWNKAAERIFGYLAEEVIGKPITILIPTARIDEEPAILERIRRGERVDHFETVRQRKDGTLLDISLTVSPVKNASGTIIGASKIARDITERKRSEAQIAMLAREAEHRVKNILATALATVNLSRSDTPEGLKHIIEGRIRALANVQRMFAESRWAGAALRRIIVEELAPYCREGDGPAQIEGPDLLLEPEAAQAMAVTLHELATNAAKYGALSTSEGRLRVEWSVVKDGKVLRWIETNGPAVEPPETTGFGTRVMKSVVAAQLKGQIRFAWRKDGMRCEVKW